jgi:hypothetical protein
MERKYRIARNKHGEVIAVYLKDGKWYLDYGDSNGEDGDYEYEITPYNEDELTFFDEEEEKNISYWDKLLHQYAGMAMQAMLNNSTNSIYRKLEINSYATDIAQDLVNRLKNKI